MTPSLIEGISEIRSLVRFQERYFLIYFCYILFLDIGNTERFYSSVGERD